MNEKLYNPTAYNSWLSVWKSRIQSAQIKAAVQVNIELLKLYWELGRDIVTQQKSTAWGDGLITWLAKDLKTAFPHLTGFSARNLFYIRKWYLFYSEHISIVQQAVAQLETGTQEVENENVAIFFLIPAGHQQAIGSG